MAATPVGLQWLALGFLANEGFIESYQEVESLSLHGNGQCVDIWLNHAIQMPRRKILTSGCTGGVTFDQLAQKLQPLEHGLEVRASDLSAALRMLYQVAGLYKVTRGVHTSALWRAGQFLATAEDVGRHNTLDKLRGFCLEQGIATRGSLLLSTGRISSEMLNKAVRMGCPVVVSRTSATSMSVMLARAWNVTLVGYLRSHSNGQHGWRMLVYSHPQQIILDEEPQLVELTAGGGEA